MQLLNRSHAMPCTTRPPPPPPHPAPRSPHSQVTGRQRHALPHQPPHQRRRRGRGPVRRPLQPSPLHPPPIDDHRRRDPVHPPRLSRRPLGIQQDRQPGNIVRLEERAHR